MPAPRMSVAHARRILVQCAQQAMRVVRRDDFQHQIERGALRWSRRRRDAQQLGDRCVALAEQQRASAPLRNCTPGRRARWPSCTRVSHRCDRACRRSATQWRAASGPTSAANASSSVAPGSTRCISQAAKPICRCHTFDDASKSFVMPRKLCADTQPKAPDHSVVKGGLGLRGGKQPVQLRTTTVFDRPYGGGEQCARCGGRKSFETQLPTEVAGNGDPVEMRRQPIVEATQMMQPDMRCRDQHRSRVVQRRRVVDVLLHDRGDRRARARARAGPAGASVADGVMARDGGPGAPESPSTKVTSAPAGAAGGLGH